MPIPHFGRSVRTHLRDHRKAWLLGLVIAVFGVWNVYQAWQLRPGSKVPPQRPNAVVCTHCGWQGHRVTLHLPQRCPRCHRVTVHFAGICPECGEWTAWDPGREAALFANPRLFMDEGPNAFFPRCARCGAQTNATGVKPSAALPPGLLKRLQSERESAAPGRRGDRP